MKAPWRRGVAGGFLVAALALATGFGQLQAQSTALMNQVRSDLNNDERWGDLGDAYQSAGNSYLASSCWAIARILDPDDSEWSGHNPNLDQAPVAIRELGITDDEWVGDLGDRAQSEGWGSAAQALYRLALDLDPSDSEWQGKVGNVSSGGGGGNQSLISQVRSDLNNDERWGDLGDSYQSGGNGSLANSCWAIARILDPDDSEWSGHNPNLDQAPVVIRELGITDDEWVGDLGDRAQSGGFASAAQALYRLALDLDPSDSEWQGKVGNVSAGGGQTSSLASQVRSDLNNDERWGDLGDSYQSAGNRSLADAAWAVARILDPDDSEWTGHNPNLDQASVVIRELGITDDEWVGDLGDRAQSEGWSSAAQALYRLARDLDPSDSEWQGKLDAKSGGGVSSTLINQVRSDLNNDERWGDLGDGYQSAGNSSLANSSWAIARILDPGDSEWSGHNPNLDQAPAVIRELGITDDEWVGDLGDRAQNGGFSSAAQALYRLALDLDPDDSEWQGKIDTKAGGGGGNVSGGSGIDVPSGRIGDPDLMNLIRNYLEDAGNKNMLDQGYAPTGARHFGELNRGASEEVWIRLEAGNFALLGVCDNECDDLDMEILDESGRQIDEDVLTDDIPLLQVSPFGSERYRVRVRMVTCTIEPCAYGFEVFRGREDGILEPRRPVENPGWMKER